MKMLRRETKPLDDGIVTHCISNREALMTSHLSSATGSALIAIIAAILLFSVLAAALLPMVNTSEQQTAVTNLSNNAQLLADAGYRYLVGKYRTEGYSALESLNDANITLNDNDGRINLGITSYFYEITGDISKDDMQFTSNPPGNFALNQITITYALKLSINNKIFSITGASLSPADKDANVTFTLDQWDDDIAVGDIVYPAAQVDAGQTPTLSNGGDLAYLSGQGRMFPQTNGRIRLGLRVLTYSYNQRAVVDGSGPKFVDVRDPNDPDMAGVAVPEGAFVILTNDSKIRSTGITGGADLQTRHTTTFHSALPLDSTATPQYTFNDTFGDDSGEPDSFKPADTGATAPVVVSDTGEGNNALTVNSENTSTLALLDVEATGTAAPLSNYRSLSDGYLSYDAQVKVGFYNVSPDPTNPIPVKVAAGLNFRLGDIPIGGGTEPDISFSGYGLSFVRGDDATIPSGIVPEGLASDTPLVVLWQQILTDEGTINRNWLAYKRWGTIRFEEDFADGSGVIGTEEGQWKKVDIAPYDNRWQVTNIFPVGVTPPSPPYACFFKPNDAFYEAGTVETPAIVLCDDVDNISLTFWSLDKTDEYAARKVFIKNLAGNTLKNFDISYDATGTGQETGPFDLTDLSGQTIKIQFFFNKTADSLGFYDGWFIDDVRITCTPRVQDSTLLVRLQEATVVKYTGGDATTFSRGDRVYGQDSGAFGTVIAPPYWDATGNFGILLLNNISSPIFDPTVGENILILGKGDSGANLSAYNSGTDRQVNIVKAYYGIATGSDTGDNDPLNGIMRPYPRLSDDAGSAELRWPPDEGESWTAAVDYFQLIDWDAVNTGDIANLDTITFTIENGDGSTTEVKQAILRSYDEKLQTTGADPEFGLHAYGPAINTVYFDDFGFRLIVPPTLLFSSPLQQ